MTKALSAESAYVVGVLKEYQVYEVSRLLKERLEARPIKGIIGITVAARELRVGTWIP